MYPKAIVFGFGFYEIFIAIGLIAALFLADKLAMKRKLSIPLQKHFLICIVLSVFVGFFGAVFFQAVYTWIETGTFSLLSGMTFYGGLIFGAITFLLGWFLLSKPFQLDKEAKSRFGDIADIAGAALPFAHAFGRIGCFFAGCCHGKTTDAWFGVTMGGEKVVPVQLLEAAFLFVLAAVLLWLAFTKQEEKRVPLLPTYLTAYGVWRFFIEYARGDERGQTIVSFLSPSQLVAIVCVAVGVAYFCVWFTQKKKSSQAGEKENKQ